MVLPVDLSPGIRTIQFLSIDVLAGAQPRNSKILPASDISAETWHRAELVHVLKSI
jgi:hypothetical protein